MTISSPNWNDYFFPDSYLHNYPDVAEAGLDPRHHFQRYGKYELRNPNPFFHLLFYKVHMMDKAPGYDADNPFDHFLEVGAIIDLWPSHSFDPVYYRNRYGPIEKKYIALPLKHFLTIGITKGYFGTSSIFEKDVLL